MFRGINLVQLDAKGRVAIPSRYRTQLDEATDNQFIVTIDTQESCLLLYPLREWEIIEEKIQGLPAFDKQARRIQRLLIGHATDVELDGNGRILIPPLLREYAELEKQVMLVGQGKKLEIWSEQNWQTSRDGWLNKDDNEDELPADLLSISL
ncbi:MAG: cell division protein MraZ [Gammaproteobacteria bacterium]|nr:cell division protein MraZ [Gammaproteobacteria bacterium]